MSAFQCSSCLRFLCTDSAGYTYIAGQDLCDDCAEWWNPETESVELPVRLCGLDPVDAAKAWTSQQETSHG